MRQPSRPRRRAGERERSAQETAAQHTSSPAPSGRGADAGSAGSVGSAEAAGWADAPDQPVLSGTARPGARRPSDTAGAALVVSTPTEGPADVEDQQDQQDRRSRMLGALGSRRPGVEAGRPRPAAGRRGTLVRGRRRNAAGEDVDRPEGEVQEVARTPGQDEDRSRQSADVASGRGRTHRDEVVSAELNARLAARSKQQRRRLLTRVLVLLAVLAAVAALVWALFFSPLLALRADRIEVTGASDHVDIAQVTALAQQETGTPLPRLNTGDLENRLAQVRGVRSVDVVRAWPPGLRVEITPRVPIAFAPVSGGLALVDVDGQVVDRVDADPTDLPRLGVPVAPPEQVQAHETMVAALTVLNALPEQLRADTASVAATSPGAVSLTMRNGATVRWGSVDETELKAAVLAVLVAEQPGRVYDVSVPDRPTVS